MGLGDAIADLISFSSGLTFPSPPEPAKPSKMAGFCCWWLVVYRFGSRRSPVQIRAPRLMKDKALQSLTRLQGFIYGRQLADK